MYLGVDIGGTKTLLAVFDHDGKLLKTRKFPTAKDYATFLEDISSNLGTLQQESGAKTFDYACVAAPGFVKRESGVVVAFGNLPWTNTPVKADLEKILSCSVVVENDAKLGGLSEARQPEAAKFERTIYLTISTGIGSAFIIDGVLEESMLDSEIGQIPIEIDGQLSTWESVASGSAIVKRFGMKASEINDMNVWKLIAHDIAFGLMDVAAIFQPDLIIFGGGVGGHFEKFQTQLEAEFAKYKNPVVKVPVLREAVHPEEAVVYGCYEMIKDRLKQEKV